ncbi:MAG: hypothetical protein ACOH13_10615 [Flavobacteriales bacterium]
MYTFLSAATLALACAFAPAFVPSPKPTAPPASNAGFQEAFFDAGTLDDLLRDETVLGVRFYNVLAATGDAQGTAMAIGILQDGSEKNAGKAYRISLGLIQGQVRINAVNAATAKAACAGIAAAGHPSYSASFTRAELQSMLDLDGCDVLQAAPADADNGSSMQLTAMKMQDGRPVAMGSGLPYQRVCGFPCPNVCGPKKNYVNM